MAPAIRSRQGRPRAPRLSAVRPRRTTPPDVPWREESRPLYSARGRSPSENRLPSLPSPTIAASAFASRLTSATKRHAARPAVATRRATRSDSPTARRSRRKRRHRLRRPVQKGKDLPASWKASHPPDRPHRPDRRAAAPAPPDAAQVTARNRRPVTETPRPPAPAPLRAAHRRVRPSRGVTARLRRQAGAPPPNVAAMLRCRERKGRGLPASGTTSSRLGRGPALPEPRDAARGRVLNRQLTPLTPRPPETALRPDAHPRALTARGAAAQLRLRVGAPPLNAEVTTTTRCRSRSRTAPAPRYVAPQRHPSRRPGRPRRPARRGPRAPRAFGQRPLQGRHPHRLALRHQRPPRVSGQLRLQGQRPAVRTLRAAASARPAEPRRSAARLPRHAAAADCRDRLPTKRGLRAAAPARYRDWRSAGHSVEPARLRGSFQAAAPPARLAEVRRRDRRDAAAPGSAAPVRFPSRGRPGRTSPVSAPARRPE
jgi:hypothetical protein